MHIYGSMQAAAKRAGPGEGGLAKLREAIEAFARKQPEQFVQLHERLVADEQGFLVRVDREQQRLRQKGEREAAEAYKQRYPIADELLRHEPPPPVPLAPRPPPRFGVNLPPELQRAAGMQLMIVEFVHTFTKWLEMTPFTMEELRGALMQRAPTVLLAELLGVLMLPLLMEEYSPVADGGPPPEVDAEAAREALALSDGADGPVPLLSRLLPFHVKEADPSGWHAREASSAEVLRWLLARRGATAAAEPEVAAALRALGTHEVWELPMWEKLSLLCWLCDEVVGSVAMRGQLQANLEARLELQAAEAKAEAERRAVARQEAQAAKEAAAAREAAAKEAEEKEEGGEEGAANPKPAKAARKGAKKGAAAGAGTSAAEEAPPLPLEEGGVTLPPDDEYDYGEYEAEADDDDDEVEEEGKKAGRGRALKRQREKATAARRDKLHDLKKRREKALEKLREATDREDLPQLTEAMRLAQGARLEGTSGGVKWRFPELSAALQLIEGLQKREQALESIRARREAVARLPLRTEPLGVDRDRTRCAATQCLVSRGRGGNGGGGCYLGYRRGAATCTNLLLTY